MINKETEKLICKKAVDSYGEISQMIKATEEMGELIRAISRVILQQGESDVQIESNYNEEIADVTIMLEQLKHTRHYKQELVDFWKEEKLICKKAVDSYGEISQMIKAAEEMGELIRAISRVILQQGESDAQIESNYNEEIADVTIMLEQLKYTRHYKQELVDFWKEEKLKRLEGNVW